MKDSATENWLRRILAFALVFLAAQPVANLLVEYTGISFGFIYIPVIVVILILMVLVS